MFTYQYLKKYTYMCVYFYLDIHNKYAQYTHIVCKQTFILNLLIAIIVLQP